jgi:hypothetical protein
MTGSFHAPLPGPATVTSELSMQFFLYEILARIVAAYFGFDSGRKIWIGLIERRITYSLATGDLMDMFFPAPRELVFERDIEPVRYWIIVGGQIIFVFGCLVIVVHGWFRPD